jgi:hypothetical protein
LDLSCSRFSLSRGEQVTTLVGKLANQFAPQLKFTWPKSKAQRYFRSWLWIF